MKHILRIFIFLVLFCSSAWAALSDLKSLSIPTTNGVVLHLSGRTSVGDGGEGFFRWSNSDLSTEVAADTLNGIYVPPNSDSDGSSGAWVRIYEDIRPEFFGAKGDGSTDDTAAFQAAITLNLGKIVCSKKTYAFTGSAAITLASGGYITGVSDKDTTGTVFYFTGSTGPMFTSSSSGYLTNFRIENVQILSSATAGDTPADQDCFRLYGVCNNSTFRKVTVRNFKGNAWYISKNSTADNTAAGNVVFDQCFVISVGKYAWYIDGYPNCVWLMPDVNSPQGGGWYFTNAASNQASAQIVSMWYEGTQAWASGTVIKTAAAGSLPIYIVGGTAVGPSGTTQVVDMVTTTTAKINCIGLSGYNWTYFINDEVNSVTYAFGSPMSRTYDATSNAVVVSSKTPYVDIYDLDGTTNQRRFRLGMSGNLLTIDSRLDNGSLSNGMVYFVHNTKMARFQGAIGVGNAAANTNTPSGATAYSIQIYDASGNSLGYIPVYGANW